MYGCIDKLLCLIKKIGEGGTSNVYLASRIDDPMSYCAVKIIKSDDFNDIRLISNEVECLTIVNHTNVMKQYEGGKGVLIKHNGRKSLVNYLAIELMENGSLFDYIYFPHRGFEEPIGKYIMTQLIDGLEACHKSGVIHQDIKLENMMLGKNWILKITDFGYSINSQDQLLLTKEGTRSYASPEVLALKPHIGVKSDIFSLGVVIFIVVTGKIPFKQASSVDNYYKEIMKMDYNTYWEKITPSLPHLSEEFKELFIKLISYDPNLRPSLDEIRVNSWLEGEFFPGMNYIHKEFEARKQIIIQEKEFERKRNEFKKKLSMLGRISAFERENKNMDSFLSKDSFTAKSRAEKRKSDRMMIFAINNEINPVGFFRCAHRMLRSDQSLIITGLAGKNELKVQLNLGSFFTSTELLVKLIKKYDKFVLYFKRVSGSKSSLRFLFSKIHSIISPFN